MMMHFLFKVARIFFVCSLVAIVLFCTLFALLQSKWTKQKIKEELISFFQTQGIEVKIEGLEGQNPIDLDN